MLSPRASLVSLFVLGVVTPLVAHQIGAACWVWLPAHWPALVAGLALGVRAGALVGAATMVTELIARSPSSAAPAAVEILVYGLVAGLLGGRSHTIARRYGALIAAMLLGRIAYSIVGWIVLSRPLAVSFERTWIGPWPGIALQLVALPMVATWVARGPREALTTPPQR